jgi:hypothetical protein
MKIVIMRNLTLAFVLFLAIGAQAADDPAIKVDKEKMSVAIPCKVAPRKLANLPEVYPLEVVCTSPSPKGQKAHETVVIFDAKPSEVQKALESLGLKPGKPARGEDAKAEGPEVEVFLEIAKDGATERVAIEKLMVDRTSKKPLPKVKWHFTGSAMTQVDPDKPEKTFGADNTGTLISIFPVTDETVVQSGLTLKEEKLIKLETNAKLLPPEGTAVTLVIVAKGM